MAVYAVKRLTLINPLVYLGVRRHEPMRLLPDAFADVVERLTAAGFDPARQDLLSTCAADGTCFYGVAVAGGPSPEAHVQRVVLRAGRYAFCQLGEAGTADVPGAKRALAAYTRETGAFPDELQLYGRLVEEPGNRWIAQLLSPLPDSAGTSRSPRAR
jgi:hypothetical protein